MELNQISRARYESFFAEKPATCNKRAINEVRRRQIHGWVILSNYPDSLSWSLWNSLTSKLPLIYKEKASYECCLSSPPDDQTIPTIKVYFKDETTIREMYLFKLDMTSMTWLKDAIFASGYSSSVFHKYCVLAPKIDIQGYVYMFGEMDGIISFHVKDRTMSLSSRSFIVRESQVLVWPMLECRLEVDGREAKQDNDIEIFDSTSESHLLNVPFHILEMIMEHCFGLEYMNFRATCKHCYLAAPLTRWQMYSPWLMVLDNYQGIISFIDPLCGDKYLIKTPQELNGDWQIFCSRYGWLLMFKILGRELVFFNPFTSNFHKLPAAPYFLGSLCFSAPPTSPDCMVVGFTPDHVYIHFVSQEAPSWRRYPLDFGSSDPYSFHIPTFSGRDIYALCNNKRIHAFRDIGKEDYSWEVVKDKAPRSCSTTNYFLSKCDQHLLLVIVGEFGESVEVFKVNDSTKEWEKMDGLGNHMIYISDTSCVCLESKSPQMGNKVYFPRLLHNEKDTKIVFYSLETCRYHTFDDKNIQNSFGADLFGTKQYCYPHTWIEPRWS